jgi:Leucine-rich repeat (LRR) protein
MSGLVNLVELDLSNNFLTAVPMAALAALTNLKFLNLGSNKIQVTDLQRFPPGAATCRTALHCTALHCTAALTPSPGGEAKGNICWGFSLVAPNNLVPQNIPKGLSFLTGPFPPTLRPLVSRLRLLG